MPLAALFLNGMGPAVVSASAVLAAKLPLDTRKGHPANSGCPLSANRKRLYTPKGIRIPVASVKGRCPRPLDDGGLPKRVY